MKIKVYVEDLKREIEVPRGISPAEIYEKFKFETEEKPIACFVNFYLQSLNKKLNSDVKIKFLFSQSPEAGRIFKRSIFFLLSIAAKKLFPKGRLHVQHSIGKGIYCELKLNRHLRKSDVDDLEKELQLIISSKGKFERITATREEAIEIFKKQGNESKIKLLKNLPYNNVFLCRFNDYYEFWDGPFFPDSSYIKKFAIKYYPPGFIVRYPYWLSPNTLPHYQEYPKLFKIFKEYEEWGEILNLKTVGDLNHHITRGKIIDVINISESLHEKKVAIIADQIAKGFPEKRIILIAGPSSSGKTTFTRRLSVQLRVNGIITKNISLDDYFFDREKTPRDENGNYDFECIEAIDTKLFNEHIMELLNGGSVNLPKYNFKTGKRSFRPVKTKLAPNEIILVEGIHGLNEKLTESIPKNMKYKIYISALTQLNIDDERAISTTDTRLLRRIVRDFYFRGYSATETLERWPLVKKGEFKNIFPFQEEGDVMFNSALIYEHAVLKTYCLPLLLTVEQKSFVYNEARRLINFLSYFLPVPSEYVPFTSILREFIGKSSFYNFI